MKTTAGDRAYGGPAFPELLREEGDLVSVSNRADASYRGVPALASRSLQSRLCVRRRLPSIRCFTQVPWRRAVAKGSAFLFLVLPFASYRDKYPEESSLASAGCASTFAVVVPRRYASLLSVYARSPFSSRLRGRLNVRISVVPLYS